MLWILLISISILLISMLVMLIAMLMSKKNKNIYSSSKKCPFECGFDPKNSANRARVFS